MAKIATLIVSYLLMGFLAYKEPVLSYELYYFLAALFSFGITLFAFAMASLSKSLLLLFYGVLNIVGVIFYTIIMDSANYPIIYQLVYGEELNFSIILEGYELMLLLLGFTDVFILLVRLHVDGADSYSSIEDLCENDNWKLA